MKLLVGYGNAMRRDDGVGWLIASQLAPHYAGSNVDVIITHQLMPEVAAAVAEAEHVIFVDASIEGQPGTVQVCDLSPLDQLEDAHALTPPGILYLSRYLYDTCPPVHLVTITGASFELGEGLTNVVHAAVPHAMTQIRRLLEDGC